MILGNIFGSRLADRSLMGTIVGVLIWNVVILTTFYWVADIAWATVLVVLLTGGSFALVPALQTRLMDVAEDAQTLAAALNHSAFNIANALGAWLGGVSIAAGFGWSSTGWVGASLAAGGYCCFCGLTTQILTLNLKNRDEIKVSVASNFNVIYGLNDGEFW